MRRELISLKSMYLTSIPRTTYLTHGFDRYPAKMIPQMARFLIERVSRVGQTVLDPFCGTGAVLLESVACGRNAVGVDSNPLAVLFAKAKTTFSDPDLLECQLKELLDSLRSTRDSHQYNFPNARFWFTPVTLRKLGTIRAVLDSYLPTIEPSCRWFWEALLAGIARGCSRADTRGPKPFISNKARDQRLGRHFDPFKLFESNARRWISAQEEWVRKAAENGKKPRLEVIQGDTRDLSRLVDGRRPDAVVTSPPYLNAQDYYRASKLELFILGHSSPDQLRTWSRSLVGSDRILTRQLPAAQTLPSTLANRIRSDLAIRNQKNARVFAKYVQDMYKVIAQISRVLRKGSYCAIVSGYNLVSGVPIPVPQIILELGSAHGFRLAFSYRDKIRDRRVPIIRNGHDGVIQEEHLLVFQKTGDS